MTKFCLNCNSELPDTRAILCRDCEAKSRQKQEALYGRKRKAFQSALESSMSEIKVDDDQPIAPAIDEPQDGMCSICFKEFYGVGSHCPECASKLDKTSEEWEADKERARKNRDNIILTSVVGLSIVLVLICFGLWLVRTEQQTKLLEAQVAAPSPENIEMVNSIRAAYLSARNAGINSALVDQYAFTFEQAGLTQTAGYNLVQHMAEITVNSSAPLAETIPAAVGAVKFNHGDGETAMSMIDTIAKYASESNQISGNLWDIASKAASGQTWLQEFTAYQLKSGQPSDPQTKTEFDDLTTIMGDLAQSSSAGPQVSYAGPSNPASLATQDANTAPQATSVQPSPAQ